MASVKVSERVAGEPVSVRGAGAALYRVAQRLRLRKKLRRWMGGAAKAKRWLTNQGRERRL
eukprot:4816206-Lingulodinium_polyedra.AAC.1